ncbi:MAG: DUF4402 domain-containing protein [Bacteroidales bacterium]|nr:DUF4402 domain-containing protein [Bacteroidales bacterium]
MKKLIALFAGLFLMTIAVENVNAQYNVSDQATATAFIITPISIEKIEDLAFGNIIASATIGTVTVDVSNNRTQAGGATFPTVPGTISSAEFTATGFSGAVYSITLPADGAIKLSGVGPDMELTAFVHNAEEVLTGGTETFQVGATLNVNADQAAGAYTGVFDVIVNYN